jgi:hypothetical protein
VARELIIFNLRVLDAAGIRWVLFVATENSQCLSRLHLRRWIWVPPMAGGWAMP